MKPNAKKWVCAVCALALCGVICVKDFHNPQEPVIIETISEQAITREERDRGSLDLRVKSAALMDACTGAVIYEQDLHKELPPASVTKVMTMLLVLEAVNEGKAKLSDEVAVSEYAASMGGSQLYMEPGEVHTLEELLSGIAIVSANDACVAVAEYIAGSEEVFVERMNRRAEELGMRDTHFANTNGLPAPEHYTSAYDIGRMSAELIKYDKAKEWFCTWQKTITIGLPGKEKEFVLTNTNKLIKHYPGANGIKTGFTAEAGYCLAASATRGNTTLISVVLGAESSKIRNGETARLLDYGFSNYNSVVLAEKHRKLKKVVLDKGEPHSFYAVPAEKITAFVKKGSENEITCKAEIDKKISLPLEKGAKVGLLIVFQQDKEIARHDLVADKTVKKASFIKYLRRKAKNIRKEIKRKILT